MLRRLYVLTERARLAMTGAPEPPKHDFGIYDVDKFPPVALVTVLGVRSLEVDSIIVKTQEWLGDCYRVVYVTDDPDFLVFRKHKALFEYLPSPEQQRRFDAGNTFSLYIRERYELLLAKWRPRKLISYGRPLTHPLMETSGPARAIAHRSHVQILFVADPRFEGGTTTALAAEIVAARRAGLRIGLLMVKAALLRATMPVHPLLQSLVDDGSVLIVDPDDIVEAELTIIQHPTIFALPPTRTLTISSGSVVLVLHHPRVDQRGQAQYDLTAIIVACRNAFRQDIVVAPVSKTVRDTLPSVLPAGATLLDEDWLNVIDVGDWPARPARPPQWPVVIGRHARPDPAKWPHSAYQAMQAYPDDTERYRVRVLGAGPYLQELYGPLPRNWELLEFGYEGVAEFLSSLDFYVYFHGPVWLEAFGRTILEALATGLVTILPQTFEPLFGPAAVYAAPEGVKGIIESFVADADAYAAQSARARSFVAQHHGLERFLERVERIFGLAAKPRSQSPPVPARIDPRPQKVLFISTNGIGLGHLTQQLAIAQRLPKEISSVFATMSLAAKVAVDAGYQVHFLPHHRRLGADVERWNRVLAEELFELIAFTQPRIIAFDGSMTFTGLLAAIDQFPDVHSIWVRRPMLRESHRIAVEQSSRFDSIIEPGELADEFDIGPSKEQQPNVYLVPPVLQHDPRERFGRADARSMLGIDGDDVVVALQLGSGNNYDVLRIRNLILDALLHYSNVVVLDFVSPIGETEPSAIPTHPRHKLVEYFPSFRFSNGFDFAVSAAGYNSFHENVFGAVPAVYVPNEAEEMDVQLARAAYADIHGYGRLLRRDHDRYRVKEIISLMMQAETRDEMRRRCNAVAWRNGADLIARFMADSARFLRTDKPVTRAWGHAVTPSKV